jgi:hypothetical protein
VHAKHLLWTLILTLVGCSRSVSPDSVRSLDANPERLKAIMRQCRNDYANVGDAECNAASEAFRRRFMNDDTNQRAE